jgi:hypothetical protein
MNQYTTACGGTINIHHQAQQHLMAHPNVLAHLHAAIGQLHLPAAPRKIEEEIDVGQIIGRSGVVKTAPLKLGERALFSVRINRMVVGAHSNLTSRGCGYFLGLIYVVKPRRSRYSIGLR